MTAHPPPRVTEAAPTERPEFLHRVIRIIAGVMLAYAVFHLVQAGVEIVVSRSLWNYAQGAMRPYARAIQLSNLGATVLLAVGAAGMLKWRSWSRTLVMFWAILIIILRFISSAYWVVSYVQAVSTATTRVIYEPLWRTLLLHLFWWIGNTFFPMLIWLILRQPEVTTAFARVHGGGFEVVPFAHRAGGATDTSPPQ